MSYDYSNLNIGKLDYTSIRSSLVQFLTQYPQFQNYDFDNPTSAINLFIDLLAANTSYNGYYLHSVLTNAFPATATTKKMLMLNANLRGTLVADSLSARCELSLKNLSGETIPKLSTFQALQTNGFPCFFYNLEDIPGTDANTIFTIPMIAGLEQATFGNFDPVTKSLDLDIIYDPTAVLLSTRETSDVEAETYWTRVDSFTNTTDTKLFTVINGPDYYRVTTNVAGSQIPSPVVTVYAIASAGSASNSAVITGNTDYSISIISQTVPSGGQDSISLDFLKTYMPYASATKDRLITQTDYIDAIYSFLLAKGVTLNKTDVLVSSPVAGEIKIFIDIDPALDTTIQTELMTSFLAVRKMAGITVTYGA